MEHSFSTVRGVILAGGRGTRLSKVIKDIPKPMAPVAGKPFLEYLLLLFKAYNVRDVTLSIGYKGEAIRSYFGNGEKLEMNITYSEEEEPLGTGGALKKAIGTVDEELFIVMNGDSYLDINLNRFLKFHMERPSEATLSLTYRSDTKRYGRVDIDNEGKVQRFAGKGTSGCGLVNCGIYLFRRNITGIIPDGNVSLEDAILPEIIDNGLFGMAVDGFFIDIGIPEDYSMICNQSWQLLSSLPRGSQQLDKLALNLTSTRQ